MVAGLIILGLFIWMSSCVVSLIRTQHPYADGTPTSAISSPGQATLQLGVMATASAVHGWRDYTPKSEFLQGEELFLYAEALNVNHDGRVDLVFDDRIVATNGKVIVNATVPVAKSGSTVSSWATWQGLWIPSDTPPGSYVASVSIRDNSTGQVGTQSTSFRVGASAEVQMGMLATCLEVRGWKDYTAQTSFMPGDQVFLYSEALNVNHEGRIDLSFDDSIFTPTGTKLLGTVVPVSTTATNRSWAAWPNFTIPSDAPPGPYTATVAVRDNVTGNTGSKSVMFTVSALNQSPTEEGAGTATDAVGDAIPWAGVAVSPDLIFARGTINAGHLILNVRFAPGTFSSSTTLVTVNLDTDQDPRTGQPGINGQGTMDADQIGSEFIVVMGSSTNGEQAQISRYIGPPPNRFTQIGHAPVTFFDDGMEVTIPLSTLGVDCGGINFKVVCSSRISASGFTSILDVLPNVGLPPIRVSQSR